MPRYEPLHPVRPARRPPAVAPQYVVAVLVLAAVAVVCVAALLALVASLDSRSRSPGASDTAASPEARGGQTPAPAPPVPPAPDLAAAAPAPATASPAPVDPPTAPGSPLPGPPTATAGGAVPQRELTAWAVGRTPSEIRAVLGRPTRELPIPVWEHVWEFTYKTRDPQTGAVADRLFVFTRSGPDGERVDHVDYRLPQNGWWRGK